MPVAITLRLDSFSASRIEKMWWTLDVEGIDTERYRLGYAPHITLAIYPDDAPIDRLSVAVKQGAKCWNALPLTLSGFGIFPGPPPILWAAPVVTPELLARHAALHTMLPDMLAHAHYKPGAWVPHVTLSGALRDPGRALAALLSLWRPLTGFLNQVDLVRFRPVEVLQSRALQP